MALETNEIEDRFEEAARTLRRLPNPPGSGPKGYGNAWPAYVQDARHAYGYHEVQMRVVPSAADIQNMEECIAWLGWLSADDARIVWMRAEGARWKQVCWRIGVARSTAHRRWAAALLTVAKNLEKNEATRKRIRSHAS